MVSVKSPISSGLVLSWMRSELEVTMKKDRCVSRVSCCGCGWWPAALLGKGGGGEGVRKSGKTHHGRPDDGKDCGQGNGLQHPKPEPSLPRGAKHSRGRDVEDLLHRNGRKGETHAPPRAAKVHDDEREWQRREDDHEGDEHARPPGRHGALRLRHEQRVVRERALAHAHSRARVARSVPALEPVCLRELGIARCAKLLRVHP